MTRVEIAVEGITCDHCETSVTAALQAAGTTDARADFAVQAPKNVPAGRSKPGARGAGERGDLPQHASSAPQPSAVNHPNTRSAKKAS